MIVELISREFGITYDHGHLSRLMRTLWLSCQKPAVMTMERDE